MMPFTAQRTFHRLSPADIKLLCKDIGIWNIILANRHLCEQTSLIPLLPPPASACRPTSLPLLSIHVPNRPHSVQRGNFG